MIVTSAHAASKAPRLTGLRCVPTTAKACDKGVRLSVGQQLQLRGRGLQRGMRVSFRWPRGALATKLVRNRAGWTARVPAGTALGKIAVTVSDRASRRSNRRHIVVVSSAPLPPRTAARAGNAARGLRR